ncbi:MAG: hypothetical protein AAFQ43_08855 [Bacteroidota bacterium]
MRTSLLLLALLTLTACGLVRGDVIVANGSSDPVLMAVAYGDDALRHLPPSDNTATLRPLAPGEEVHLGRALALADSGGVTVAFYSVPESPGMEPQMLRVEAAGAGYLRDALGDTVLRID